MEWSKEVPMINFEQWEGFEGRIWKEEVNVRDFIQKIKRISTMHRLTATATHMIPNI